jgi:hypothetical protein
MSYIFIFFCGFFLYYKMRMGFGKKRSDKSFIDFLRKLFELNEE